MLLHAATPLLSVGDIMGSDSPEQPTKHIPLPADGSERKLPPIIRSLLSIGLRCYKKGFKVCR